MSQLERHIRDCRKSSYFLRFASDVTSQCGEDGIIEELFKYLPKVSMVILIIALCGLRLSCSVCELQPYDRLTSRDASKIAVPIEVTSDKFYDIFRHPMIDDSVWK